MNEVWQLRCIVPFCPSALVPELTVHTELRGRKLYKSDRLESAGDGEWGCRICSQAPSPPAWFAFQQGVEGGEKETTTVGALSQNGVRLLSRLPVANLTPPPEPPLENYSSVLRALKHHIKTNQLID